MELEISNFIVVKSAQVSVKRVTIIIGGQAQGKSIISKLIYFFSKTWSVLLESHISGDALEVAEEKIRQNFINTFPGDVWKDQKFTCKCRCAGHEFVVRNQPIRGGSFALKFYLGSEVAEGYSDIEQMAKKIEMPLDLDFMSETGIRRKLFNNFIAKFFSGDENKLPESYYIPALRSFFAHIEKSVFSFISSNLTIDHMIKEFGGIYQQAKGAINYYQMKGVKEKDIVELSQLSQEILLGKYSFVSGKEYIHGDKGAVEVRAASSGQQEALPLLLMLRYLISHRSGTRERISYVGIEEPEAHLFPGAQWSLVKLLSVVLRERPMCNCIITTHSPYILSAINVIIELSKIDPDRLKKMSNESKAILLHAFGIPSDQVSAYQMSDGECKSIMDSETNLINGDYIDSVSNILSSTFTEMISEP